MIYVKFNLVKLENIHFNELYIFVYEILEIIEGFII